MYGMTRRNSPQGPARLYNHAPGTSQRPARRPATLASTRRRAPQLHFSMCTTLPWCISPRPRSAQSATQYVHVTVTCAEEDARCLLCVTILITPFLACHHSAPVGHLRWNACCGYSTRFRLFGEKRDAVCFRRAVVKAGLDDPRLYNRGVVHDRVELPRGKRQFVLAILLVRFHPLHDLIAE